MTTKTEKNRIAVLSTHLGEDLVIRANPSEEEVRSFVSEQNRRYHAGEPGGPSGLPAFLISGARYHDAEDAQGVYDESEGEEIDLSDSL